MKARYLHYKYIKKQGQKRPLDTPKRKIERRERKRETERERNKIEMDTYLFVK